MKKFLSAVLVLTLTVLPLLSFAEAEESFKGVTLNVYNWGEYIDEEVLRAFEKEYGCRVNYKTYDSNESMYTNISGGDDPWDILVPSDYMIERLIKEGMLE